jgi:GAF domain
MMLPESDCRVDRELAEWFSRRGGAWSGTAGELLSLLRTTADADRWLPESSGELCTYLQSHRQVLQSLGVDVLLRSGFPRTVSLRPCHGQQPDRIPSSSTFELESEPDNAIRVSLPVTGPKNSSAMIVGADLAGSQTSQAETNSGTPQEGFVLNSGEALFTIVEMRRQIQEQGLSLESAVDLVIDWARQITQSCGIAVGFLPQEIGSQYGIGIATSGRELNFHANLFQDRLVEGEAVQIADAQAHPRLGAACRREGIGSLIMVPIFRNREVAGAIEFFFQEKRSFSVEDVMDLGLIAGVIGEGLGGTKYAGERYQNEPPPKTKTTAERPRLLFEEKKDSGGAAGGIIGAAIDSRAGAEFHARESTVSGSPAPELASTIAQLWLRFKRAWLRHSRGM